MKKYQNKLNSINKRIEEIKNNGFYCDYDYKIQKLENNYLATREYDTLEKERKYINLRYIELEKELYTLLDLQAGYEELLK